MILTRTPPIALVLFLLLGAPASARSVAFEEATILRQAATEQLERALASKAPAELLRSALQYVEDAGDLLDEARSEGESPAALLQEQQYLRALRYWLDQLMPGQDVDVPPRGSGAPADALDLLLEAEGAASEHPLHAMILFHELAARFPDSSAGKKASKRFAELRAELAAAARAEVESGEEEADWEMPSRAPEAVTSAGVSRLPDRDQLLLVTGERYSGTVLDTRLTVESRWGRHALPLEHIAGFWRFRSRGAGEDEGYVKLVDVTGFRCEFPFPHVQFQLESGQKVQVPRDRIRHLSRRLDPDELDGVPRSQLVVTKDDFPLRGVVHPRTLTVETSLGAIEVDQEDLVVLLIPGRADQPVEIRLHNGDVLRGALRERRLTIQLDLGEKMVIPIQHLAAVYPDAAPAAADRTTWPADLIRLHSGALGLWWNDMTVKWKGGEKTTGLKFSKLSTGEPAHDAGFRVGDYIFKINDDKYISSDEFLDFLSRVREGRLAGFQVWVTQKRRGQKSSNPYWICN
jgi:hypothetical protein